MTLDVERSTVGYAAAGLALVVAAAALVRTVFFDLSLTVRVVLFGATFLIVFAVALETGWDVGLLVLAAFLAFAGYGLMAIPLGPLFASMGALAGLVLAAAVAYAVHEPRYSVSRRQAQLVVVGAVAVSGALVGLDLRVGEVTYDLTVREEATISPDPGAQAVVVGTATATAESPFREPVTFPEATACVYAGGERADRSVLFRGGPTGLAPASAPPGGSTTADATVPLTGEEAASFGETVPVELADACPDETDGPRIVVVPEGYE